MFHIGPGKVGSRAHRTLSQGPTSHIMAPILKMKKLRQPRELKHLLNSHRELVIEVKTQLGGGVDA